VIALGATLGAIAGSRDARAAGFATQRFGGEQGNPVTTNPTALYYNPAGIGFSEGIDLYLDGQLALRNVSYTHTLAPTDPTTAPADIGNTGTARAFNLFGGPALGATMKLGNFAAGVGLFVPFGGRQSYSKNSSVNNAMFPLASDGVQRWRDITASLTFAYVTAGVAYRFGPLSIGVTGNLISSMVQLTKAQNLNGQLPDSSAEGRDNLDVSAINGSFAAGLMLEAVPDHVWLGASYQAQPGLGPQTLKGTLDITSPSGNVPQQKVILTQALPDIIRAGVRWRPLGDVELRLFGDYTRWSVMKAQCIGEQGYPCQVYPDGTDASGGNAVITNYRRDWNDTVGVRVGASYWLNPNVELFAGTGFETAAIPDSTLDPAVADADSIEGAIGGRFFIANYFYLAASYTHLQFFNRNNTGLSQAADASAPTQQPDSGGKYTQWVGIFDVNVEKTF
jgi:long-chain fatty acid transport protein